MEAVGYWLEFGADTKAEAEAKARGADGNATAVAHSSQHASAH